MFVKESILLVIASLKCATVCLGRYMLVLLTNLSRHVFSLNAPTHPAKLTMNTTPPSIAMSKLMFSIRS